MRTIWKHEIPIDDQWHEIPQFARPVHVAMPPGQRPLPVDRVCLWAEATHARSVQARVFATGQPLPDWGDEHPAEVVGTAVDDATGLVWHVVIRFPVWDDEKQEYGFPDA